ncbi:MAG: DUF4124 domain-containing protein [Gammaproteobacteria bacterium]|nr:DUF4124 domain-containing protein [Gammaproteobacteria bacterium]
MKFFVKLMITALVLAVLLPFTVLKGKDGRPLMSLNDLKAPDLTLPEVPDAMNLPEGTKLGKREDIIYQWRDAKGELHFTSAPPPKGVEYTAKGYDPNANLIQSIEVKHEEAQPVMAEPQIKKPTDIGNPYSPDNIQKLIDDAHNVQQLMNERMKQQESILNSSN